MREGTEAGMGGGTEGRNGALGWQSPALSAQPASGFAAGNVCTALLKQESIPPLLSSRGEGFDSHPGLRVHLHGVLLNLLHCWSPAAKL